jgi:hypothetical protein
MFYAADYVPQRYVKPGITVPESHAEGHLVYNSAARDGQNGNPGSAAMSHPHSRLFDDLGAFIESYGVSVSLQNMDIDTPGTFDGLSIAINPKYDRESASYYLAHAFGSIVQWSVDGAGTRHVFDELDATRKDRRAEPSRFETALTRYHRFEETSSEHAVWMVHELGHESSIAGYTLFFRADLEAMMILHRTGKAPCWPDFFATWKGDVDAGSKHVRAFTAKPFGRFVPTRIERSEIIQEQD